MKYHVMVQMVLGSGKTVKVVREGLILEAHWTVLGNSGGCRAQEDGQRASSFLEEWLLLSDNGDSNGL